MLRVDLIGSYDKTEQFLRKILQNGMYKRLESYAEQGRSALAAATPEESGQTANSWSYEVILQGHSATIWWRNEHLDPQGTPIAILLELGHGTGTGGYVQGRHYINPAMQPVFDSIADQVWKEVTSS